MKIYVLKSDKGYLTKHKWRECRQVYSYYFTDEIKEAVLLSEHVANAWLNRYNQENEENIHVEVKEINVNLIEYNKKEDDICFNRLVAIKDNLYVSNVYIKYGELLGYKYSENLYDAKLFCINGYEYGIMKKDKSIVFYEILFN